MIALKATIRTYDAVNHQAAVEIIGSTPSYLAAVPVAANVHAADCVAGRTCVVTFFDPANPSDGAITAVVGPPSAGGGGVSDHGLLTGLADDDHAQYALLAGRAAGQTLRGGSAASEHLTLQSTAHATRGYVRAQDDLQLLSNYMRDSGGNLRLQLATSAPHATLHDYVRVDERLGIATDPVANVGLKMRPTFAGASGSVYLLDFSPGGLSLAGATVNVDGVHSDAIFNVSGYNVNRVAGLYFFGYVMNDEGHTLTDLMAVYARVGNQASYGAITRAAGLHVEAPAFIGETYPTEYYGLRIKNPWTSGDGTTAVGILCEDPTDAASLYTAWLGADLSGTPKLRLDAGDPAANQSQLHIMVNNGSAVLRRVQIGAAGSGGTGYRLLRVLD